MKKPVNLIVSFILVLMIVIVASKSMEDSYSRRKIKHAALEKREAALQKDIKVTKNLEGDKPAADNVVQDKKNNHRKSIVIDPGHASRSNLEKEALAPDSSEVKIKDGGGAQGVITKTPEYVINMKVALKLRDMLKEKGHNVKMTKEDNSQSLGNVERADIGNKERADIVVRIHADSSDNQSVKGASVLVPGQINENTKHIHGYSKRYGEIILNRLCSEVGMSNRGVVERNDMTGFNWSKVPVVLVEMGFLSNSEEDQLLSSDVYQEKIAKALSNGITEAIK